MNIIDVSKVYFKDETSFMFTFNSDNIIIEIIIKRWR
jgi:hypothetical protein